MKMRVILWNIIVILVFGVLGFTHFTEGVETIKIIGLFATGAVIGNSFANLYHLLRIK